MLGSVLYGVRFWSTYYLNKCYILFGGSYLHINVGKINFSKGYINKKTSPFK